MSDLTEKLKALEAEATPAPWAQNSPNAYGAVASTDPETIAKALRDGGGYEEADVEAYGGYLVGEWMQPNDREFVAEARNALPSLLEYVELLEAVAASALTEPELYLDTQDALARLVEWREQQEIAPAGRFFCCRCGAAHVPATTPPETPVRCSEDGGPVCRSSSGWLCHCRRDARAVEPPPRELVGGVVDPEVVRPKTVAELRAIVNEFTQDDPAAVEPREQQEAPASDIEIVEWALTDGYNWMGHCSCGALDGQMSDEPHLCGNLAQDKMEPAFEALERVTAALREVQELRGRLDAIAANLDCGHEDCVHEARLIAHGDIGGASPSGATERNPE